MIEKLKTILKVLKIKETILKIQNHINLKIYGAAKTTKYIKNTRKHKNTTKSQTIHKKTYHRSKPLNKNPQRS